MSLGERITEQRYKKGLSQEELASHLSVSRQTVQRWETGKATPGLDNLVSLSELYGVSTEYLLKGTPDSITTEEKPVISKTETRPPDNAINRRIVLISVAVTICLCIISIGSILFYPKIRELIVSSEGKDLVNRTGIITTDDTKEAFSDDDNNTNAIEEIETTFLDSEKEERDTVDAKGLSELAKSVLFVEVYDSENALIGTASGFIIDDGQTLVTNYHVIEDAFRIIATTADGEKRTACNTIIAWSEVADLAVLRCEKDLGVLPLELNNTNEVSQGEEIYAIGYPLGIANTISDGIISSIYKDENGIDIIQITAPISSGSSGGAVLDKEGKVIGVICAYYTDGQNLNLSIPVYELMKLLSNRDKNSEIKTFELNNDDYQLVQIKDLYLSPKRYDGCLVTLTDWIGFNAYQEPEYSENFEEVIMISDEDYIVGRRKGPVYDGEWTEFPELFLYIYYYSTIREYNVKHITAIIFDPYREETIENFGVKMTIFGKFTYNPDARDSRLLSDPALYQVEVYSYFVENDEVS